MLALLSHIYKGNIFDTALQWDLTRCNKCMSSAFFGISMRMENSITGSLLPFKMLTEAAPHVRIHWDSQVYSGRFEKGKLKTEWQKH